VSEIEANPIRINGIQIIPIPMMHGKRPTTSYRIRNFAYLTDTNYIPPESFEKLHGVELVVIDGLAEEPSSTHFSFQEAVAAIAQIRPKKAWITHLCHAHTHVEATQIVESLRAQVVELADCEVKIAYDGLKFQFSGDRTLVKE
jgi:phosphoribosyl 1,2-cyclic phosphate phosphodiesterase